DDLGRDERRVAEREDDVARAVQRPQAVAQRRRLALLPVRADDRLGGAEVDLLADARGVRAEHDDDALEGRDGALRGHSVLEERPAAERRQRLRAVAEPRPPARRQDEAGRAHSDSSTAARSSSDASECPGSRWSAYGTAATMPRVSGAKPGCAASGLSQTT